MPPIVKSKLLLSHPRYCSRAFPAPLEADPYLLDVCACYDSRAQVAREEKHTRCHLRLTCISCRHPANSVDCPRIAEHPKHTWYKCCLQLVVT